MFSVFCSNGKRSKVNRIFILASYNTSVATLKDAPQQQRTSSVNRGFNARKKTKTTGRELTQYPPVDRCKIFEEVAEKVLSEDERAALACVPGGDFAARMVAAQKPEIKSVVVLKKELSGGDPDFLTGIHKQLATLSVTKHGDASGYAFVRSVLKKANPNNQLQMMGYTQLLTVNDAMTTSARRLGEAKTLDETELSWKHVQQTCAHVLQLCWRPCTEISSGPEPKLMVQNNVAVNEGGRAIVGALNQIGADKEQFEATNSPPANTDQFGTKMRVIEPDDDQSATAAPRVERTRARPQARKGAGGAHDKHSQAQRRAHAFQCTLRCTDPLRWILQIARSRWKEALSHAWWCFKKISPYSTLISSPKLSRQLTTQIRRQTMRCKGSVSARSIIKTVKPRDQMQMYGSSR